MCFEYCQDITEPSTPPEKKHKYENYLQLVPIKQQHLLKFLPSYFNHLLYLFLLFCKCYDCFCCSLSSLLCCIL